MEDVASSNTQAGRKYCPAFSGGGKEGFPDYESEIGVCLPLCSKSVFNAFQGKAQPSYISSTDGTATPNTAIKWTWKQASQSVERLFLTSSASANNAVKE